MLQLCLDSQISHKILEAEIRQNTSLFLRSPWSQVTRRLHHWSQDTIHTLFHFSSSAKMAMVATIALSTSICLDQEHITWSDQNISKDLSDLSTLPPPWVLTSTYLHLPSLRRLALRLKKRQGRHSPRRCNWCNSNLDGPSPALIHLDRWQRWCSNYQGFTRSRRLGLDLDSIFI